MVMQLQTWTQDSLQHRLPQTGKVDWDSEDSKNMQNTYSLLKEQMTLVIETLGVVDLQPHWSPCVMFCGRFFSYLFIYTLPLSS